MFRSKYETAVIIPQIGLVDFIDGVARMVWWTIFNGLNSSISLFATGTYYRMFLLWATRYATSTIILIGIKHATMMITM